MKSAHALSRLKHPIGVCVSLCIFTLALCAVQAEAQEKHVPKLGSQVPPSVLRARTYTKQCLTDIRHIDPCASVRIDRMLFTIAWDTQTKTITYLFTDDRRLVTDSELGVGGRCRLVDEAGKPDDVVPYIHWLVTPKWTDTIGNLSGDARWDAVLRRDAPQSEYGKIVGFVQSRYLKVQQ